MTVTSLCCILYTAAARFPPAIPPRTPSCCHTFLSSAVTLFSCTLPLQVEPQLPLQGVDPFSLPKDWLLVRPPRYEQLKKNLWVCAQHPLLY